MRKTNIALALALGTLASSAMAEGFFVGAEAGITSYPDYTSQANQQVINAGAPSSTTTQDAGSTAFGIFGGQWVTDNFGWEAGYTDLGSVKGTTTATGLGTATYKYSASALYAAGLGGIKLGIGTLYGKAGLYNASVKYDETMPAGFIATPGTDSSTGIVIGGGYSMTFMQHLTVKAEVAIFNGVKFHQVFAATGTKSDNITKIGAGVAYAF